MLRTIKKETGDYRLFPFAYTVLISERIPDQNHVYTACGIASAGDNRVAAHAFRRETVMAESGHCTGRGFAETHTVCGCRDVVDSADAVVYRGYDFVHADNKYNLLRSVDQGSDTVAVTIDIDQLAVLRDGIGTHEIDIAAQGIVVDLFGLCGIFCLTAV